jgi:hypothetical protein
VSVRLFVGVGIPYVGVHYFIDLGIPRVSFPSLRE